MRTRRIRIFALTAALAVVALGLGGTAALRADHLRPIVPVPSLTDGSAGTQTPRLFTVTGQGFTPGGRVYLAVYDQMGARLYETRWITASPALPVEAGPTGHEAAFISGAGRGGTLREGFADLCGATAMTRALDDATATWSNWLTVEPDCIADVLGDDGSLR